MVKIKKIFDPYCILGLDNIFPKEYLFIWPVKLNFV
jgi:hypothetical protein